MHTGLLLHQKYIIVDCQQSAFSQISDKFFIETEHIGMTRKYFFSFSLGLRPLFSWLAHVAMVTLKKIRDCSQSKLIEMMKTYNTVRGLRDID